MRMAILWPNDHILYSYYNSYLPLRERIIEDFVNPEVVLVLDVIDGLCKGSQMMQHLSNLKRNGTKIISFAMDPAHFPRVDELHECVGVDHFFVTDPRFIQRYNFGSCSHVDFTVNPKSIGFLPENKKKFACYFGHLNWDRKLPDFVTRLQIQNRKELMNEVAQYKFGLVFDTGADETGTQLFSYNKGKYLEYLSVGTIPVVQPAIRSEKYGKYFLKMSDFTPESAPFHVDMEDIYSLNMSTLDEIILKCEEIRNA